MTCFVKHTNCKILTLLSDFVPHLFCMSFAYFFSRWVSKIRLVIVANFLKRSSNCCNCLIPCHCLQFPILKVVCWLLEFAGCLFMTLYLWNCLEAMVCEDGFYCSSVGLLVFANIFYKKKQETCCTIQGHILASC